MNPQISQNDDPSGFIPDVTFLLLNCDVHGRKIGLDLLTAGFPSFALGALYMIKDCDKFLLCGWMNGSHPSNLVFILILSYIKHATQSMMLMIFPHWSQNHRIALLASVILELQATPNPELTSLGV